jgi:hypothetical protein
LIPADYDVSKGAYIEAIVYFPSTDNALRVPFLLDTGSSSTAVSVADLGSLAPNPLNRLALRRSVTRMTGLGGSMRPWLTDAGIALGHDDGRVTQFRTTVAIIETPGIPSLLGRDILSKGYLHFDGMGGSVRFDIETATFRLDAP